MNYLIPTLLLVLTCVSGFADETNQPTPPRRGPAAAGKTKPGKSSQKTTKPATSSGDELANEPVEKVNDPWERLNHTTFRFNDSLTIHAVKPIARGYEHIVPQGVRNSLSNFFDNLDFPIRFGNNVLQGRFVRSGQEVGKFVVNTTAGIGGLFRVSDHVSSLADVPAEDFGLTLGRWGFSSGPYLVIPLLGPTTVRDLTGYAGDFALNPLNWYLIFTNYGLISRAVGYSVSASRFVVRSPGSVRTYEQMKEAAVDPYIAVRNAYLSHRAAQLEK
ncbi:MAG: VacJ family lipoprotein [Verrucomicrobia bacterium]|nr:VacJ family lipoprotein [Verrucomicrobiota bacterium]MBV8277256.1 VacJ family lipoprotein [Verrucomicrobiota bacterium]